VKLNLGSGQKRPPEGYVNIDIEPRFNPDVVCNLAQERWPFDDNSMTEGICSHVMEHLGGDGFFHFLREMYRVGMPGAVIHCAVPHPRHDIYLNDPTHVRPITLQGMSLFSKRFLQEQLDKGNLLTPFADLLGVDFNLQNGVYKFDAAIEPEFLKRIEENRWFFEKHFYNIVHEIQFQLVVVKGG